MSATSPWLRLLPTLVTLGAAGVLLFYGPLLQPPGYNDFADQSIVLGLPHAVDVLSNIGFAGVGVWGLATLHPLRGHPALRRGWSGYELFLVSLVLTAVGSAFYHVAPDNHRLIWDRIPIALACAGLLAAVRAETHPRASASGDAILLAVGALVSVTWWAVTDAPIGAGDLRPYVLLQGLTLVLIPLWQAGAAKQRQDRIAFGIAVALYVAAKAAELSDRELLRAVHLLSGHSLKHLFAAAAAAVIVYRLRQRTNEAAPNAAATPIR